MPSHHLSCGTIVVLLSFYLMCSHIEMIEGRFLWDLSNYCINYCSRINGQMPLIGVCSCHRIASHHRRMIFNDLQMPLKQHSND